MVQLFSWILFTSFYAETRRRLWQAVHHQFRKSYVFHLWKILQANMIVTLENVSLFCGFIAVFMVMCFLTTRSAKKRKLVNNDERPVLASRTITNGERRWESENICIQTRRHFPTEHDERYVLTRKFPETYLDDSAIF